MFLNFSVFVSSNYLIIHNNLKNPRTEEIFRKKFPQHQIHVGFHFVIFGVHVPSSLKNLELEEGKVEFTQGVHHVLICHYCISVNSLTVLTCKALKYDGGTTILTLVK